MRISNFIGEMEEKASMVGIVMKEESKFLSTQKWLNGNMYFVGFVFDKQEYVSLFLVAEKGEYVC